MEINHIRYLAGEEESMIETLEKDPEEAEIQENKEALVSCVLVTEDGKEIITAKGADVVEEDEVDDDKVKYVFKLSPQIINTIAEEVADGVVKYASDHLVESLPDRQAVFINETIYSDVADALMMSDLTDETYRFWEDMQFERASMYWGMYG